MERVASRQMPFPAVVAAVLLELLSAVVTAAGCSTSCGNISIPYPFGIEPDCYHEGFNLTCDYLYRPPKLFLGDGTVEVLEISIPNGTVRINSTNIMPMSHDIDGASRPNTSRYHTWGGLRERGPFFVAPDRNEFLVLSCNNIQVILMGEDNSTINACATYCPSLGNSDAQPQLIRYLLLHGECSGLGCCNGGIPKGYTSYHIQLQPSNDSSSDAKSSVYIAEEGSYNISKLMSEPRGVALPALLDWVISNSSCQKQNSVAPGCRSSNSFCQNYTSYVYNGYQCRCSAGYRGNPYILDGCQDIDECVHKEAHSCHGICENTPGTFYCRCPDGTYGNPSIEGGCIKITNYSAGLIIGIVISGVSILLLALSAPFVTRMVKLRKVKKMREKLFNQNHGLLLQQLISQKADIGERMMFTLGDIEKATNNFDKSREVGGGGHGVVYKGILDLHVVAIKKSKIVVQREIDEFINEVAILSQINHRNVVKLLGCCLETEVPLLVYEFISNGTLYHHLHVEGPKSLSWDDRLRIALEIARALAYLHSATSMPIFHRDIKSSNILLDESLIAKVSDFGASRYIPIDQTAVMTAVQGTLGYLDPMYYYTGRLTDKSDVFSFGVLLIELLTRKKPYVYRSDNDAGLVAHFVSSLKKGDLADIVDPQVMEEEDDGELQEVAMLAAMCTRLEGESRPTMKEVEMALENLRARKKPAPCNSAAMRYDGDQIVVQYNSIEDLLAKKDMPVEGGAEESSRQYTMEEEIMLSARYPR
ncbi:Wall-associated receptor kinase 3 [Triticum urartu]|uniref:Wall-associated receptor kinase 3 n=1 Tax=Triticum urartu TaxID=4572 RepID=M8AT06_TRIUA|nr:wall-associated receptor kinase 3-like [Triticum urartu]EMS64134.1 Wall-associated receptor kinase 3 [Triticum urartu]